MVVLRLVFAAFWTFGSVLGPPPLQHVQPAAEAFVNALQATGFMTPWLLGGCFLLGGAALWFQRTAPLGLALLSPPMLIIVLFHIFLGKDAGPWIVIALIHAILLWHFRSAFTPLWSFSPKALGEV